MTVFDSLWSELEPIGRNASTGGYRRYAFDTAELDCRAWFIATAESRGLDVELDRNTNLWAWWVPPGVDPAAPALVIGSHLDSVPDGGAFDGPLGVVSAFAALDAVRASGVVPDRPVALVAFADEEGHFEGGFLGSRSIMGELTEAEVDASRNRYTGQPLREALVARAASGTSRKGEVIPGARHTYPEYAAAGLWTTASDYGRFYIALQNAHAGAPHALLTPASAAAMMTPVDAN